MPKDVKSPAFNFYSSDFLTGTIFMTNEQKGAYITLMCYQHQYGHLTEEQIKSVTSDKAVLSKFRIDSKGLYYNERLEIEIMKKNKYCESRSNNRSRVDNTNTCVYLIRDNTNNLVKIGSSNNPERRLLELKNQYHENLEIIAFVKNVNQKLEKELHEQYRLKNKYNEWFLLSENDIETIIADNHMNEHMSEHMENEIEIENIKEIINYLNNKLNTNFKYKTKSTQSKIKARLNEGYKLDDFIAVIDKKYDEWKETEFEKFLRPETLFGTKFESYLNQKSKSKSPEWFNKNVSSEKLTEDEEQELKDMLKEFSEDKKNG